MGDKATQVLGWYVRNCALSPIAATLEHLLFEQCKILDAPSKYREELATNIKVRRRQLRELHCLLKRYTASPWNDEILEQNALFARDEFGLDDTDFEILLLTLRYQATVNWSASSTRSHDALIAFSAAFPLS